MQELEAHTGARSLAEQLKEFRRASTASDVFSLAATLYFAATGMDPGGRLEMERAILKKATVFFAKESE